MREKVREVLSKALPSVDFDSSDRLFDDGIIDSIMLLKIVSTLGSEFGIEIGFDDLEASNFNSIDSITALVNKHMR